MKKNITKVISLVLILSMFSLCVSASGINSSVAPQRYTKVIEFSVDLKITSRGYAACMGELQLRDGATANMTVTLLKSSDKSTWIPVDSWSASGSSWLLVDDGCFVMSGYYYATKISADVYGSDGSFIEHVSSTSNIDFY